MSAMERLEQAVQSMEQEIHQLRTEVVAQKERADKLDKRLREQVENLFGAYYQVFPPTHTFVPESALQRLVEEIVTLRQPLRGPGGAPCPEEG